MGSKAFTIDGRNFSYRDPKNGDQHSYDWSNPLYEYSKSSVKEAAGELGIKNVNKKREVHSIVDWIENRNKTNAQKAEPEAVVAPERDPAVVEKELAELNSGRDRYDNTRLDRPENNQPRYGFSDDPYRDAIGHGDDLNAHYQNKFIPSLRAEAELTAKEIGFSGRDALNNFVGKVPRLGDPKDLFSFYSDQISKSA